MQGGFVWFILGFYFVLLAQLGGVNIIGLGRSFVFNLDVEQGKGKTQEGIELGVFQREDTLHEWQQC